MNETQVEFLETTMALMAQAKNATSQAQSLVSGLLLSFGVFISTVINEFNVLGTDYASRLRAESAFRAQSSFSNMLQNRIYSLKRQTRMYQWGLLNVSRPKDLPQDEGSCTLLGVMCSFATEVNSNVFVGTYGGNFAFCDVTDVAYSDMLYRGSTADQFYLPVWPPYIDTAPNANLSKWKSTCLAPFTNFSMNITCPHGTLMEYPNNCSGTCGYDPRCRGWYNVHLGTTTPTTEMSAVYIDIHKQMPVIALSYPIYDNGKLVAVAGTDFFFDEVDSFLSTIGNSGGASQLVGVILNTSDFLVVGASRSCPNGTSPGGVPIVQACHSLLRGLAGWLTTNRAVHQNATFEQNGTLWDVYPSIVDTFTYFVVVGMNKTEVYAVVDSSNKEANATLQTLSKQQAARMAESEASSLAQMDALSSERIAVMQALQVEAEQHAKAVHNQTEQQFNASRKKSSAELTVLIAGEMSAIAQLKDYHLSQVVRSIGPTFGAVIGIFVGILLLGSYGTWIVTKQIQNITETMEDVANMKVEELQTSRKSSVKEVERIETALGILVQRLAEYKSYMPAGLFQLQQEEGMPTDESPCTPGATVGEGKANPQQSGSVSPHYQRGSSSLRSGSSVSALGSHVPVAGAASRLMRRNVAVMAVNIVRFRDVMQCSAAHVEGVLNRFISSIHRVASKEKGNIDIIVGDQVLVTFNAHFGCSDPPATASHVALELQAVYREEFASGLRIQTGLAAGPMYAGHLGYAQFKAMVALGAPMKVASLLAHLSGFEEHVVLVCPSVAERIKYHFVLQPADLVTLPTLGESAPLYAKGITVFMLMAHSSAGRGSQEWLYEVNDASAGLWTTTFSQVAKAPSLEKAKEELAQYLKEHPEDRLARRLGNRLTHWQPRVGIVIAEQPDVPRDVAPSGLSLSQVENLSC
eukprot:GGOE01033541.1.p1 GENE.GGOE01033541.1~~GGOE01033541.1.p1  ORF type:complete len:1010 (+),score=259.64 GGOE01033541.1:275-3031(+)